MPRPKEVPPTGGLQKALFVLHMNWVRAQVKDSTRARHVRALREECKAFLERTREYEQ